MEYWVLLRIKSKVLIFKYTFLMEKKSLGSEVDTEDGYIILMCSLCYMNEESIPSENNICTFLD
jgi:hypothetical protein